jgi:cell filamentation protein
MYEAQADLYCYPATSILKNIPDIRSAAALERFERAITAQRAEEGLPRGRLSVSHYRSIHRHLLQDVYRWAGQFRTVRVAKGESVFCYPENIPAEMKRIFAALKGAEFFRGLSVEAFSAAAAHFLSELNAIHPFREGNGRVQLIFIVVISEQANHPLDLAHLEPDRYLSAIVRSFRGDERALAAELLRLAATN